MKFVGGQTVGIDLGTSSSAVARLDDDGNAVVIDNAQHQPITPSVVILGPGERVMVGPRHGWMHQIGDPERAVVGIKRQMGNPKYVKQFGDRQLTPELISGLILTKLKQDAERQIGEIGNAVITVPYYFNDPCRRATRLAGKMAGLNVVDLLNEPTAATLAYAWMKGELGSESASDTERTILVYDLGGGTFDVTVVKYRPMHFAVIATDGDTFLGGLDWTRRLVDHINEQFKDKYGINADDNPRARLALTEACDEAKRELSTLHKVAVQLEWKGRSMKTSVSRREFERMCADLLQRTRDTTELVLDGAGIDPKSLDEILLVGGSTYMPSVQAMLQEVCGRPATHGLNPQMAVAQGAALHAAILEARDAGGQSRMGQALAKRLSAFTSRDVNSHSLGVELTDPARPEIRRNHIMIPRNSRLPCEARQRFVTTLSNPQGIRVRLMEGEASDADSCTFIGDVRITNLPANLPVGSPVQLTYSYDANRRVQVTARELTGNNHATIEFRWSSDDAAVAPGVNDPTRVLSDEYVVD